MKITRIIMLLGLFFAFTVQSYAQAIENIQNTDIPQQQSDSNSQTETINETPKAEPVIDSSSVFLRPDKKDLPRIQRAKDSNIKNPLSVLPKDADNNILDIVTSAAEKAKIDKKTQKAITEADNTYKKMQESFQAGNTKDAKKYFGQFIKQLSSVDIEPGLLFFFFDDIENILMKMNNIYEVQNTVAGFENTGGNTISLHLADEALIEKYIKIFTEGKAKERIKAAFERSGTFKDIVEPTFADFKLPAELKYLPVIESLYQTGDVSRAGAAGIWQIMPARARALGLHVNYWIDERFDPEKATEAAALYLKQLYLMLNDWHLALAAYNRGEYGLVRDMQFSNASDITEMVKRNAIPRETQNYIPQFIAVVRIIKDPAKYGFKDINYRQPLKYDKVKTDKVIDLKIAAECAETTLEEIKRLNPALKAWCTPQGYPGFELKIPYGSRDKFLENIAKVEDLNPTTGFIKYKIAKGDSIGKIAETFKTTEKNLIADNPNIKKTKYIQPGMVLTIRPGKGYFK